MQYFIKASSHQYDIPPPPLCAHKFGGYDYTSEIHSCFRILAEGKKLTYSILASHLMT